MYSLSVIVGPVVWAFMFKTLDGAVIATDKLDNFKQQEIAIEDDFGQRAWFRPGAVGGFMLEDLEKSKLAHQERLVLNERIRSGAQQMARSDPRLTAQGPGVITPFSAR